MTFCPQAVLWGDVATWMSAAGALIIGGAVVWISRQTNSLAAHANATHQSLQRIEEERDQDRRASADNRRTLALASISSRISLARSGVTALIAVISDPKNRHSVLGGHAARLLLTKIDAIKQAFPTEIQDIAREVSLEEGARVLRAFNLPDTVATLLKDLHNLEPSLRNTTFLNIVIFLKVAEKDLEFIGKACVDAEERCGIRDVPTPEMLEALRATRNRGH